jgi:hypothetical protein
MAVTLDKQPIRATVVFGRVTVKTPDVVSFNVTRARGQMCATFSASVKVPATLVEDSTSILDSVITISAGEKGRENLIFTGKIYRSTVTPIFTDASKVMLNLAGKDMLCIMEGQKINRRVKSYKDGDTPPDMWGIVTAITRDNSPLRASFPVKVVSALPKAIDGLPKKDIIRTLSAYDRSLDRLTGKTGSGITWEVQQ